MEVKTPFSNLNELTLCKRFASKWKNIPPYAVLILGIVFAIVILTFLLHIQSENIKATFYLDAQDRGNAIKREIALVDEIIESLKSYFEGSEEVKKDEFKKFTYSLINEHAYIRALGWAPRVRGAERDTHKRKGEDDTAPGYGFGAKDQTGTNAAAERGDSFPLHFIEPYEANKEYMAYDLYYSPVIAESLDMALERGGITVTGKIKLMDHEDEGNGFMLVLPVFENSLLVRTVEDRRNNLKGYVLGIFTIEDVIEDALSYVKPAGINLYVYDQKISSEKELLYYYHVGADSSMDHIVSAEKEVESELRYNMMLDIGQRKWLILFEPQGFYKGHLSFMQYWSPWAFFAVFLIATCMLSAYIKKSSEHTNDVENLAQNLSAEIVIRKKAEKESKLFESLIHQSNDAIFVINPGTSRFLNVNTKACENLGYSRDELLSMGVIDIEAILPDNFSWEKHIEEVREAGFMILEGLHSRKDGTTYPAEINAKLVCIGETEYMVAVARDITERKKSNEKIKAQLQFVQTLLDTIPNPVFYKDCKGRYTGCNKAFEDFLGRPASEIVGKTVYDMGPKNIADKYFKKDLELIENPGKQCYEWSVKSKDGKIRDVVFYKATIMNIGGEVDGLIGVILDITERKLMEEEIKTHRDRLNEMVKERTAELEDANKQLYLEINERRRAEAEAVRASQLASLGELAAGVAHEINNPINGIINYSQLIANKNEEDSWNRDIAVRIIKEGDRISNIVANLLSFARVNDEKMIPARVSDILSEALSLTHTHIRKDGIKLEVDVPPDLPAVHMNSQQIEQVFLNIISNARYALNQKYGGTNNGKKLEILGEHVMNESKPSVRIIFCDNGVGIPSGIQNKIMNPFFTTKPSNIGTGLGLSITHGIISQHDGNIAFDSVEGEFTRVMIDLPQVT